MERQVLRVFFFLVLLLPAGSALAASGTTAGHLSTNWAGYTATRGPFEGVGAAWTVPALTSTSTLMTDVTWVGIGGSKSKDLIQAGTQGAVQGKTIQYWAWYELLPAYQERVPLAVRGGDKMSVSLAHIGADLWLISMTNVTTGESFYKAVQYDSKHTTAEWIQEMPTVFNRAGDRAYAPLSEFGTVTFTDAYAVVGSERLPLSKLHANSSTMVSRQNKRVVLAQPSPIVDGVFSVTRTAAVPGPLKAKRSQPWEILWTLPKQ